MVIVVACLVFGVCLFMHMVVDPPVCWLNPVSCCVTGPIGFYILDFQVSCMNSPQNYLRMLFVRECIDILSAVLVEMTPLYDDFAVVLQMVERDVSEKRVNLGECKQRAPHMRFVPTSVGCGVAVFGEHVEITFVPNIVVDSYPGVEDTEISGFCLNHTLNFFAIERIATKLVSPIFQKFKILCLLFSKLKEDIIVVCI